jgi:hypothetical protein
MHPMFDIEKARKEIEERNRIRQEANWQSLKNWQAVGHFPNKA